MPSPQAKTELAGMVGEIFELMKIASTARARARAGKSEEVTETEFLALDALVQDQSLTVGEIQKQIGVLPAQMSRIIRSLETKGNNAFVLCNINPRDRRRIDVRVTPKGRKAHQAYRAARLSFVTAMLNDLTADDRRLFMRIIGNIRDGIRKRMEAPSLG